MDNNKKEKNNIMYNNSKLYINKKDCCGCGACYNICPKMAITMEEDKEGFMYPVIDEKKCIKCSFCLRVCPLKNSLYENN